VQELFISLDEGKDMHKSRRRPQEKRERHALSHMMGQDERSYLRMMDNSSHSERRHSGKSRALRIGQRWTVM
jgi:hypothetical protein